MFAFGLQGERAEKTARGVRVAYEDYDQAHGSERKRYQGARIPSVLTARV